MTCECKCYSILSCRPCQEFQDTDLVKLQKNNVSVGYQGHLRFGGLMYRNVKKWVLVFVKRPRVAVPYSFSHKKNQCSPYCHHYAFLHIIKVIFSLFEMDEAMSLLPGCKASWEQTFFLGDL